MTDVPRRRRAVEEDRHYAMHVRQFARLGESRWESPVMSEGSVRAISRGEAGAASQAFVERHQIDNPVNIPALSIANPAVLSYQLTYVPSFDSWNVTVNGVTYLDTTHYTISGRTITFVAGVLAAGDNVQVQYDWRLPDTVVTESAVTGTNWYTDDNASISLPAPSGTQVGDLLLLFTMGDRARTLATPSGWSLLHSGSVLPGAVFGVPANAYCFAKIAATGDLTGNLALGVWSNFCEHIEGVVKVSTVAGSVQASAATYSASTGTTITAPTVTTTTPCLIVYGHLALDDGAANGGTVTFAAGPTVITTRSGLFAMAGAIASDTQSSPGTTSARTSTASTSSTRVAFTVAVEL